jgi:hypothetical protein
MHHPLPSQGQGLRQVVTGFFAYHAVPTNFDALAAFRYHIMVLWMRTLTRRSQKDRTGWIASAESGGADRANPVISEVMTNPRRLHCDLGSSTSASPVDRIHGVLPCEIARGKDRA